MGRSASARCGWIGLAALLIVGGAACGPNVETIDINMSEVRLSKVGQSIRLEAVPRDRRGAKVDDAQIVYRSRDPGVASVGPTGEVTAVSHGTTTLDLIVPDTEAMEFVRVVVRLPEEIDVRPSKTTLYIGGTKQLTAKVLDQDGDEITNVPIEWSSSDDEKARVEEDGELTGLDEGNVTITAKALDIEGSSEVRVTWAPKQKAMIEAEKRRSHRRSRSGGGGSEESDSSWDPRLGMFQ